MRDNGFLEDKGPGTVGDLLKARPREVIVSRKGERIDQVIEAFKRHGISQMPVLEKDGTAIGMIAEYDLLNGLIGGSVKMSDTIDRLVNPLQGVVTPESSLNKLREIFAQDNVAVVREGQKVTAVVTKIDLIDFLAGKN